MGKVKYRSINHEKIALTNEQSKYLQKDCRNIQKVQYMITRL